MDGWMQVWRFADGFTEKDFYLQHTLASLPQPYLYLLHVQFRINPFIVMASEVDGNMNSVVEFLNFVKLLQQYTMGLIFLESHTFTII